jgi:disulfide bond formation protein DsbB
MESGQTISFSIALAIAISSALLSAALYFEHFHNILPCKLCTLQRYPHAITIVLGIISLSFRNQIGFLASILAFGLMTVGTLLAGYHAGIELQLWAGPNSCENKPINFGLSAEKMLEKIQQTPIIACNRVTWSFLTLSMAGWNTLFSACLTFLWGFATKRTYEKFNSQFSSSASQ